MNQQALEGLAAQRMAEIRESAAASRRHAHRIRVPQQSLRVRTGWRLVDLGLKLVAQPNRRRTASPRPAGS